MNEAPTYFEHIEAKNPTRIRHGVWLGVNHYVRRLGPHMFAYFMVPSTRGAKAMSRDQLFHRRIQGFRLHCAVLECTRYTTPESIRQVDEALAKSERAEDIVLYGNHFRAYMPDGTSRRVDPAKVVIEMSQLRSTAEAHSLRWLEI